MKATSRGRRAIYLTLTAACALSAETAAAAAEKVPLPRPRPVIINVGTRLATPAAITPADADAAEASISDPVARKLAEWVILRSDNTNPTFQRYAAFVEANPSWPHSPLFRRRAENALWNDGVDDRTVRAFFARQQPATAK